MKKKWEFLMDQEENCQISKQNIARNNNEITTNSDILQFCNTQSVTHRATELPTL